MMQTKLFEVLDDMTFMPCIAILLNNNDVLFYSEDRIEEDNDTCKRMYDAEMYLLRRSGYDPYAKNILFGLLDGTDMTYDTYKHNSGGRTMQKAHEYIKTNWDKLESGQVIDVQYVLGETDKPKESEKHVH